MKKFYKLSTDYMMNSLVNGGTLSKKKLKEFVETSNTKQMMQDMKNTPMGRKWFSRNLDVVDKVPRNMRFNWCKHNIRFSMSPPIVLISYIFLKETEILNIITIIEGVKYRLSSDDIKKRKTIPPVFVFKKADGRDVKFLGLAVPGIKGKPIKDWLVAVWGSNKNGDRFQNYKSFFTILNTSSGNEIEEGFGINLA